MRPLEQRREELELIFQKNQKSIIYSQLADCFLQDRDDSLVDRAIAIAEIGIKNYPDDANGHFVLGQCYQKKGDTKSARSELERTLKFFPSHLGAIKLLLELNSNDGLEQVNENLKNKLVDLDPLNKIGSETSASVKPIDFSKIDSEIIESDSDDFLDASTIDDRFDDLDDSEFRIYLSDNLILLYSQLNV
jgi:tetratricopeptide (TPR) repeat protein